MKVCVVGGTNGQVARSLAQLDSRECAIIVGGRPEVDLAIPATLPAILKALTPDVVINAGAYTAVDQAESDADAARAINAQGVAALGAACANAGIPLVHISTDYVFDGAKTTPYIEADPTGPLTVYGATKLEGEKALQASGVRHVTLRVSWVHAPEGKNFVRTMLRLAKTRERVNVVADQIGRPTYAPHLAIALRDIAIRLVMDPSAPTGVFHLTGSGEPCSWRSFAQTIFEASRLRGGPAAIADPITTAAYPTPAKRPANSTLDCSRIAQLYGLTLPDWRQGVGECVTEIGQRDWELD